jgi:hypothetical protein
MVMFNPGALQRDPRLGHAIRRVRVRYSFGLLIRGLAAITILGLLGVAISAWALDVFRYSQTAVFTIRALFYAWSLGLAAWFLARPMWSGYRRASDAAIARYVEEHEPSLDAALRSAVEEGSEPGSNERRSHALQRQVVDDVVTRLEAFDLPNEVDRSSLRRGGLVFGAVLFGAAVFVVLAPAFIRQAIPYLFDPFANSGRKATPYAIAVTPGNHTVARGSDLEIVARLSGFEGPAEFVSRTGIGAWTRSPMIRDEAQDGVAHRFIALSVQGETEYFVESAGTRSDVFRLAVVERPYVKNVDLEYRFPAYARLDPQRIEGTGDITALAGTRVVLSVTPTVQVKAGRLIVQGSESQPVPLETTDGLTLRGQLQVGANTFYRVELQGADGAFVVASPDYVIEAIPDLPPRIAFSKPGRDSQATPIEEVFTEVKAEDDFGVMKIDLVYSLNGGAETVLDLHKAPVLKDVVAGHTFFLEDMSLKPGDFIAYYARATDVGAPGRQTSTDIYFLEARPYRRDFRQAEQSGGGGGGGGGGNDPGSLSQQQRQVIAATFRLVREQSSSAREPKGFVQDSQTIALIQSRLRTQVEALVARMSSRGALPEGSPMHGTADELRQAISKMSLAEAELKAPRPKAALPNEQAALAHLQRAEASFRDVQVSFGGGGGGGGGQSNSSAEELADLYELDIDKLRNQYETLQSGAQEKRDQEVDEAMSRLQELARRQEQENERARQRGGRTPNQAGGGSGGSQRQLADEAEEIGRKLERLTREQNGSSALEESARRLREAAAAMRQQASSPRGQSASGGQTGGTPLDRLREARRLLDSERSTRLDRDLAEFSKKAKELERAQSAIAGAMRDSRAGSSASGARSEASPEGSTRAERSDRLRERKDSLAAEVAELEARMDKAARDARRDQKETSRKLQEASNGIRDTKLKEKIRYTKGLVDRAGSADSEAFEADIGQSIEAIGEKIGEASSALGTAPQSKKAEALDRARDLARALDSMGERLKAKGSEGAAGASPEGEASGAAEGQGGAEGRGSAEGSRGADGRGAAQGRQGSATGGQRAGEGGSSVNGGRPGGGGGLDSRGGRLGASEARQLRSEIGERVRDAEAFRRALEESGLSSAQAAALAGRLQGLASDRNFKDPLGLAALTAQVAEDVKMLEYVLRREAEADRPTLQLSGSEELPPGYRAMVEEYYKTLARKPRK